MLILVDVLFLVAAFFAEVVGTVAGFGSATILLPVGLVFFDFKTALVLAALTHLFGNAGRLFIFRKHITWRTAGYFALFGIASALVGASLVPYLSHDILTLGLGIFLVVYGLFGLVRPSFKLKPHRSAMIAGGIGSGFLAGVIGTGGALRSAFLTAFRLPKARYIGTSAAIAVLVDGSRIPVYLKDGLLSSSYYLLLPVLLLLALAGSHVGKKLVGKVPQLVFGRVVLATLIVAGGKLIFDYLWP